MKLVLRKCCEEYVNKVLLGCTNSVTQQCLPVSRKKLVRDECLVCCIFCEYYAVFNTIKPVCVKLMLLLVCENTDNGGNFQLVLFLISSVL